jgi:HlyD family secretion protein
VDNTDGAAIPGMSANVSIITGVAKDVLVVDNKALKFSPADNKQKYEKQGVWILTKSGLKRYDVEIGLSDDTKSQIISKELKEKDKVIVGILGDKKKQPSKGAVRRPF